jgi:hypothetical protein
VQFTQSLALVALLCSAPAAAQEFVFAPAVSRACTPGHLPTRVVVADIDVDGAADLLLPGRDSDGLVNWVSLSAAGVPGDMQSFEAPGQTDAAVAADFNHDGLMDLAFAIRSSSGRLAVYLRTSGGLPQEPDIVQLDREPRSLVSGDWNGDGFTDLASAQYGNQAVLVLLNDRTGHFAIAQRATIEPWAGGLVGPQELLAGDVNGDGRTDLVTTTLGTRRIDVLLANSDGTFATPVAWMAPDLPNETRPGVTTAALGDLDNDGDLDVAVTLIATAGPQPLLIFVNDGVAGFEQRLLFEGAEFGLGWGTAIADMDSDGDLDVVTATALSGGVHIFQNITVPEGAIQFAPVQTIASANFPRDIALTNVDGDCDLDIAYAEIGGNSVRIFRQLRECGAVAATAAAPATKTTRPTLQDAAASARIRALVARGNDASQLAMLLATYGEPADIPTLQALAGESCGPSGPGGRCDEVHMTPGCFTTPCCEHVCSFDPECCTVAWDQLCVDIAADECDGMVCPQYGACDQVHEDGGCEDTACCQRITRLDGYCQALWDHICVQRAADLCGTAPCTVDIPAGALDEDEICYQNLNDGPNYIGDAVATLQSGQTIAGRCNTDGPRDSDWFPVPGTGARRVQLLVNAEFPCEVHLIRGAFAGPLSRALTVYGGQCTPVTLDSCITDDAPWHVVVTLGTVGGPIRQGQPCLVEDPDNPWDPDQPPPTPGFDGDRYVATLTVSACAHPADLNGDGIVDGADLGALLGQWGLTGSHPADLNGDSVVDGADLGALLGAWGPVF